MTGKLSTEDVQLHPDKKGGLSNSTPLLFPFKPIKGFDENTSFIIHHKRVGLVKKDCSHPDLSAVKHNTTVNSEMCQKHRYWLRVCF